jgi:hypothetical protein
MKKIIAIAAIVVASTASAGWFNNGNNGYNNYNGSNNWGPFDGGSNWGPMNGGSNWGPNHPNPKPTIKTKKMHPIQTLPSAKHRHFL